MLAYTARLDAMVLGYALLGAERATTAVQNLAHSFNGFGNRLWDASNMPPRYESLSLLQIWNKNSKG